MVHIWVQNPIDIEIGLIRDNMLVALASWIMFIQFATAPPHFAAIFRLVYSAAPIEIFLIRKLFATYTTSFDATLDFTLLGPQSINRLTHGLDLILLHHHTLFYLRNHISLKLQLISKSFNFIISTGDIHFMFDQRIELITFQFNFYLATE